MNPIKEQVSCCDEYDPNSLSVDQALSRIRDNTPIVNSWEKLALKQSLDRVLFEPIYAPINVPPLDNSAMDGYAFNSQDLNTEQSVIELNITATVMAGQYCDTNIEPGQCARIMTGAVLPPGTDTVVMQEQVEREDGCIRFNKTQKAGQNVRKAGEDIAIEQLVLDRGHSITAPELGLLASLGLCEVLVFRQIRVSFFSTGDELQSLGTPLKPGQIYDSNRYTLFAMLKKCGAQIIDMGVIPDDRKKTEQALQQAASQSDLIVTSGGVSVGEADFVKTSLDKLGAIDFWRIAMKPGKPLAFGKIGNCLFFGLPGNPVSTMVTFFQFVIPAINKMSGKKVELSQQLLLPCTSEIKKVPGRMEYQRGIMFYDSDERLAVKSTGGQGSGILRSMSQANCFIILPEDCSGLKPGTLVKVQPFNSLY